jgi:NAD(P)-dependent dehydrogenase (short-subunit alcohol dehydrogenase family)
MIEDLSQKEYLSKYMQLSGKVCVVTGGANGIGRALAMRLAGEQAIVTVADCDAEGASATARDIDGIAVTADVSQESDVKRLADSVTKSHGRIDLFCSNAGIMVEGGEQTLDADWQRIFGVNVMAHIYAARAVLPQMLERGEGYLLQTVSAAGLLSQIGSAPYAVTKHAALAFAEWLSITYGDRGIRVSAICPQGVRTAMLLGSDTGAAHFLADTAVTPEQVADAAIEGIHDERFLILPHPEVAEYFRRKATDYDRWLRGMRRLQATVLPLGAKA